MSYVESMASNREAMQRRLQRIRLTEADQNAFGKIETPVRVAVLTEDWCGDSLMSLPILARVVEAIQGAEMRIFRRDEEPSLQAHFASRGIHNIPVFTFMDESFRELGCWVERAAAAHQRRNQWMEEQPQIQAILRLDLPAEEKRDLLRTQMGSLKALMEEWYEEGLQQATVEELKGLING